MVTFARLEAPAAPRMVTEGLVRLALNLMVLMAEDLPPPTEMELRLRALVVPRRSELTEMLPPPLFNPTARVPAVMVLLAPRMRVPKVALSPRPVAPAPTLTKPVAPRLTLTEERLAALRVAAVVAGPLVLTRLLTTKEPPLPLPTTSEPAPATLREVTAAVRPVTPPTVKLLVTLRALPVPMVMLLAVVELLAREKLATVAEAAERSRLPLLVVLVPPRERLEDVAPMVPPGRRRGKRRR